jgi:hypothetical protein
MTELYYVSEGVDKPIPVITSPTLLTESVEFQECSHVIISGDLSIGTALAPITDDEVVVTVGRDSTVIVDGKLSIFRDIAAANPLVLVDSSAKLIVTGGMDIVRDGAGAGGVFRVAVDSLLKVIGTLDLLSFEGVPVADGSFINADRNSRVWLDQVLFATGADLDMGQVASILMQMGADLHVTDVTGASDALNSHAVNPGAGMAFGIRLVGGARAFLPDWQTNTGIGASGAVANGLDHQCGGAAATDWAGGGSEILTDIAAVTPELCLTYKP